MSTPTCNTCETKFPGKETCKLCGNDPNGPAAIEWKIAQAKIKQVAELNEAKVKAALVDAGVPSGFTAIFSGDVKFEFDAKPFVESMKKLSGAAKLSSFSVREIARIYQVPTRLVVDHERMVKERATRRALIRSLQSARTSQRHVKHGRVGVR